MSRAFLICPEPIRHLTAGVGSRFLALAGQLAKAGHAVTLAIPNDPAEAAAPGEGIELVQADPSRLGQQADGADWVLLHGHLGNHYLSQRDDKPVVVDLYDPFLVENLHYHREMGFAPFTNDHATWRLQLSRGDFFLCSSSEQRLYYLGLLTALGRVNPLIVEDDHQLAQLIVELPFGTPEGDPPPAPPREEVLGKLRGSASVLYFGGIYDWFDPFVVLDALESLVHQHPELLLVFVEHPHPELTPLSVAARVKQRAERSGWLGSHVRFVPWRPFPQRFEVAQVADVAVVTHRSGLETDLSLRTRLVDLLWLGVPVVTTAGGAMARVVGETGAGLVVPAEDASAVATAMALLLGDRQLRERSAEAGRRWAVRRTWEQVVQPLLRFAEQPRRDRYRQRFASLAPGEITPREPMARRLARRLRRLAGVP